MLHTKVRKYRQTKLTKNLRKVMMKRSQLKIKYFKTNTAESLGSYKKQKNFCSKLNKKEKERSTITA